MRPSVPSEPGSHGSPTSTTGPDSVTVLWFRRDLRLHDQPALDAAMAGGGRVAPIFVVDDALLHGRWQSANRTWLLRGNVLALAAALEDRGAPLTVLRGDPVKLVPAVAAQVGAARVAVSRDYAPYGRHRDERVEAQLARRGIGWVEAPGQLIQEPRSVLTGEGRPYRVYGPFRRAWHRLEHRVIVPAPDRIRAIDTTRMLQAARGQPEAAAAAVVRAERDLEPLIPPLVPTADPGLLPEPGEPAARRRLDAWASSTALDRYATGRDRLDLDGTSRLGADLRFGLLSPIEVAERCAGPGDGRARFLDELAWRDFYGHLLWHEPRVARHAYRDELDDVAWARDPELIEAWREGRTGYPVVDAAMRQLRQSGWMHNRARMITAMFLTKDLGVDWRVGEQHFMAHLVDGDPASNNGGWQWAASTGTDPQPWFRVFNPTRQGQRHDPYGSYVRRWIPELAGIPGSAVHEPPAGIYVAPIVDHSVARGRALDSYRAATRRS
jgi:deoxyribodipyrimidine photo-lyase